MCPDRRAKGARIQIQRVQYAQLEEGCGLSPTTCARSSLPCTPTFPLPPRSCPPACCRPRRQLCGCCPVPRAAPLPSRLLPLGHVANFVESEQLLQLEPSGGDEAPTIASYIEVRRGDTLSSPCLLLPSASSPPPPFCSIACCWELVPSLIYLCLHCASHSLFLLLRMFLDTSGHCVLSPPPISPPPHFLPPPSPPHTRCAAPSR